MHSFLLQIYCRLLQPTVSSSLNFEPKSAPFTEFFLLISGVCSNQKVFKSPSAGCLPTSAANGNLLEQCSPNILLPGATVLLQNPNFFPHPRPLVGNHHQPADNPLLHSLQAFERPSVLQQSRFALTRSTCSGFYQNVCNLVRPQPVPDYLNFK